MRAKAETGRPRRAAARATTRASSGRIRTNTTASRFLGDFINTPSVGVTKAEHRRLTRLSRKFRTPLATWVRGLALHDVDG
jgi:hypothetical protein